MGSPTKGYTVEFSPAVKRRLAELPPGTVERIVEEMHALAELAHVAPIPAFANLHDSVPPPPLHVRVDDWLFTYAIHRRTQTLVVTGMMQA